VTTTIEDTTKSPTFAMGRKKKKKIGEWLFIIHPIYFDLIRTPRIPPELFESIIKHIHSSPSALKTCLLVSSQFNTTLIPTSFINLQLPWIMLNSS
jgi:hypothetical protein